MKVLIKTKLSEHKYKTPEGYLVCQDAILARTGAQEYYKSEIYETFDGEDEVILVYRNPEQVFAPATLASFEDKPITVEHPDQSVNPENYKELSVGHTRNIRKGKFNNQDVMIGDLIITDANAIKDIESGVRTDLSCGYDCDITDGDKPEQINIRGNHVALCEQGRAGIARIIDSKIKDGNYKGYSIQIKSDGAYVVKDNKVLVKTETEEAAREWIDDLEKRKEDADKVKSYTVVYVNSADKTATTTISAVSKSDARKKMLKNSNVFRVVDVTENKSIDDAFSIHGFPKKFDDLLAKYPDIEFEKIGQASFKIITKDRKTSWDVFHDDLLRDMNPRTMDLKPLYVIVRFDDKSILDSAILPADIKNKISNYLSSVSHHTNNDVDIFDIIDPIKNMGIDITREHIDGWRQLPDGKYRKDYFFNVDGYKDTFMVSFYTEPNGKWKVDEVNAYFTGRPTRYDSAPAKNNLSKYVIFKEDDGLKGSTYNNYYLYGNRDNFDDYSNFNSVEALTEYLIDTKNIKRENIIFVKDAFTYKKPAEVNKIKLRELNKLLKSVNTDAVKDDEKEEMINHQKRKIKEKILAQIKKTEAEIEENADKGLDTNINVWYNENFDTIKMNDDVTFNDLFDALDNKQSVYELLGLDGDKDYKVVKNCLTKLAELINAPYDYVYEQWMSYED